MPHDGHLVQGGLSVEDDDVIVSQVPLHRVSVLQRKAVLVSHESEIYAHAVVSHDIPGHQRSMEKRGRIGDAGVPRTVQISLFWGVNF